MSLRTDFTSAVDTKLAEARTSGNTFVKVTNLANISAEITAAAAKGLKEFTVNLVVTYQPQDLRLNGCLLAAFVSGMEEGLYSEDIMSNEVSIVLNVDDTIETSFDLNFTF